MPKQLIVYERGNIMSDKAAHTNELITYVAGSGLVVAGITVPISDVVAIFGFLFGSLLGTATLALSWYYKRKMYLLAVKAKYEQDRRKEDR